MMIWLTPIVSRSKSKCYKAQKVKKYALNSQLQALQISTNDDEVENVPLHYHEYFCKLSNAKQTIA